MTRPATEANLTIRTQPAGLDWAKVRTVFLDRLSRLGAPAQPALKTVRLPFPDNPPTYAWWMRQSAAKIERELRARLAANQFRIGDPHGGRLLPNPCYNTAHLLFEARRTGAGALLSAAILSLLHHRIERGMDRPLPMGMIERVRRACTHAYPALAKPIWYAGSKDVLPIDLPPLRPNPTNEEQLVEELADDGAVLFSKWMPVRFGLSD